MSYKLHSFATDLFPSTQIFNIKYLLVNNIKYFNNVANFTIKKEDLRLTKEQELKKERLKGLPIIHHHGYVCSLPANHRFPMQKFNLVFDHLVRDGVINRDNQVLMPLKVSREVTKSVHTSEYVKNFFNGLTTEKEQTATGFKWSEELVSRVRYETGGTLLAALLAAERGMACSTAGGTHHAFPDHGAGFCLINDLAVTARALRDTQIASKVLIVDLDVHQGDGTAFIFLEDPSVFTFSMHGARNYPFRKQRSDMDVELANGMADDEFLATLAEHFQLILDTFRPDFVLYDAGVDPHCDDLLGKLHLTDQGLFKRDKYVLESAVSRGIPVATVIGGGYSSDVNQLALRHTIVHRAATKIWGLRGL